jgi:hypothetical protein
MNQEKEEKIKCNICGKYFNPANLYTVFLHEHKCVLPKKNYKGKKIK